VRVREGRIIIIVSWNCIYRRIKEVPFSQGQDPICRVHLLLLSCCSKGTAPKVRFAPLLPNREKVKDRYPNPVVAETKKF